MGRLTQYLKGGLRKANVGIGVGLAFIISTAVLYAGDVADSLIQFNPGDVASSSQVNNNFTALGDAVDLSLEGFACTTTADIVINPSGGTPTAVACDNVVSAFPSYTPGAYLYTVPEDGVYRIHRSLISAQTDTTTDEDMDNMNDYSRIYIDDASDDIEREIYQLNVGQTVDIKILDFNSYGAYEIRPGSLFFIKRIF